MSFYPDPTRGRETVVGGSNTGVGTPRTVEYLGRRVVLIVEAGVERELNSLAREGVTVEMLWQALGSSVQSRALNDHVTVETVNRLHQAIVDQRGTTRRTALNNIAENPGRYFAGRQEYPNEPARQGGRDVFNAQQRQEFPDVSARQGGRDVFNAQQRQEFPDVSARQGGGRDAFNTQQQYPNVSSRQGGNPFDTSRPSGRGQFTTGGGSTDDRK